MVMGGEEPKNHRPIVSKSARPTRNHGHLHAADRSSSDLAADFLQRTRGRRTACRWRLDPVAEACRSLVISRQHEPRQCLDAPLIGPDAERLPHLGPSGAKNGSQFLLRMCHGDGYTYDGSAPCRDRLVRQHEPDQVLRTLPCEREPDCANQVSLVSGRSNRH
jgi:hypothetical protein